MFNYSFWADESGIASIAEQMLSGVLSPLQALSALHYQKLHIIITALFFKLFGVSEFAARLPSLLGFAFGIYILFLLGKKLSNTYGGLLAAFLYGFSHLNLAYATQAKPYIALEGLLLGLVYVLSGGKKSVHLQAISICIVATLLHNIGVFLWILYFVYLLAKIGDLKKYMFGSHKWLFIGGGILIAAIIFPIAMSIFVNGLPFKHNHLYQVAKLFLYKYTFIVLFSGLGYIWSAKKYKVTSMSLAAYAAILLIFVSFVGYIFNIRYVLSLFGILFLYFGVFWAMVGERFQFKMGGKAIIPIVVMIVLYATGYKIVRIPQAYYNPNIDKYGDVQIANYKDFYSQLKQRFPNYKKLYIVNDTFDAEYWYMGRYSNAFFMKFADKPYMHGTAKVMIYGSLADFKSMMKKHPQGLLIMEDWQSFLPDDIKEYAKKNLHLEFRVESLREAPSDPWPLALYSWGFDKQ